MMTFLWALAATLGAGILAFLGALMIEICESRID